MKKTAYLLLLFLVVIAIAHLLTHIAAAETAALVGASPLSSARFYHLLAATILLMITLLTLISFFIRVRIAPAHLPSFIFSHFKKGPPETVTITGKLLDQENDHPIHGANIYIYDTNNERIIARATSNRRGLFSFSHIIRGNTHLSISKTGYLPLSLHKDFVIKNTSLRIGLTQKEPPRTLGVEILSSAESFFSYTFELWLIFSFVLLILVGMSIGWIDISGFLVLAIFNLILWTIHHKK